MKQYVRTGLGLLLLTLSACVPIEQRTLVLVSSSPMATSPLIATSTPASTPVPPLPSLAVDPQMLQATSTTTPPSPPVATTTPQSTATPFPLALSTAELAYLDDARDLWLLDVGDSSARRKITTQGNIRSFAWAPDGQTLAYLVNGAVWLYDMQNGQPECLCPGLPDTDLGLRLSWSPQQQYLVLNQGTSMTQKLALIKVATGQIVRELTVLGYVWGPTERNLLIGRRHYLQQQITLESSDTVDLAIVAVDNRSSAPQILLEGSAEVLHHPTAWLATGKIQYSRLDWNEAAQIGEQSWWAASWQHGELGEPERLVIPTSKADVSMRQRIVERLQLRDAAAGTLYWDWSPDHTKLAVEAEAEPGQLYLLAWESNAEPDFLGTGLKPSWRPARED